MKYKYQKGQVFGKRLKIPKEILNKVYSCTLTLDEYFNYYLYDKIPTSCLIESDRQLIEKMDTKLLYEHFLGILMHYDRIDKNMLVQVFYNDLRDKISEEEKRNLLINVVLKKNFGMNDQQIEDIINDYGKLLLLIQDRGDIFSFISGFNNLSTAEERFEYIKQFTDNILSQTFNNYEGYSAIKGLANDEYKELFKYSSLEDYLKKAVSYGEREIMDLMEELKTLPSDYIFDIHIPFLEFCNLSTLRFISTYGLKNVVDFDNENENFLTKNGCRVLRLIEPMYLHNSYKINDPNKTFHTKKNSYDENGNYINRMYTKDEFYEAIRRMLIHGPTDEEYKDKVPDYREMNGEFCSKNADLFISDDAPDDIKKLFYTKSITPRLLVEHPEYIQYLIGKNLGACFKYIGVKVQDKDSFNYENLIDFLSSKMDSNELIAFITEYCDVFDIVFTSEIVTRYEFEVSLSKSDTAEDIKKRLNNYLNRLIIEKNFAYPKIIPKSFIETYPSMFLSSDAPKELLDALYSRAINSKFISSNPTYRDYLKNIDLEILFKYMPVSIIGENNTHKNINFINIIKQIFSVEESWNIILLYGEYIEKVFEANQFHGFKLESNFSQEDFLKKLDSCIFQTIIDGKIKYDENMPEHFKKINPTLFLGENVPENIRNKFYNRELTLDDFNSNLDLLEIFGDTNIVCGFSEDVAWMIPLFQGYDNLKEANFNRLKVISEYLKIQDVVLQNTFIEFILELGNEIKIENINVASEVLSKLYLSNSTEIFTFRKEIATQILKSATPLENLKKIEDVFIRNNIPTVGKIYSCFEILHPDFQGFYFDSPTISPVLKKSSTMSRKIVVFFDLLKASFGSNNRSINEYLKNIEVATKLYDDIITGKIQYEDLDEINQNELLIFCKHLVTLYNNTQMGKKEGEKFVTTGNILTDIHELTKRLSIDGTLDYNLADRIIRMFCGFAGINSLKQAKEYVNNKIQFANSRNRNAANSEMILEKGDYIKGIGGIGYLRNILQNGCLSKEYLGASASSDNTPLDTDVSIIMSNNGSISLTSSYGYGPIWFVLKNDDRFITTRNNDETLEAKRDLSKLEVFYTGFVGIDHYGIRTGFASSDINYIVVENYDSRIGLEIAMNGFYIPVADINGKIVFTPNDYDRLREKMSGLSYFGENNYLFSNNLITEEVEYFAGQIEQSNYDVQAKKTKINEIIRKSLDEIGLSLKTTIDGDLTEGVVELIDTGSTGRGTNKPGDGDFDFMMRLDKTILSNHDRLYELKNSLMNNFGKQGSSEVTDTGDFRFKNVQIDSDVSVDIDITFTEKTDKIAYSTDMALQDRLTTIRRNDPEKYKYVVANILLAKQILKKAGAYKPCRGEMPQGGLGGVGIENWILQNGGSFIDAANSFVEAANGLNFDEFKKGYQIWDFGDNHLAERRGVYSHDNFVFNNMSEDGYQKMVQALKEYLKNIQVTQVEAKDMVL